MSTVGCDADRNRQRRVDGLTDSGFNRGWLLVNFCPLLLCAMYPRTDRQRKVDRRADRQTRTAANDQDKDRQTKRQTDNQKDIDTQTNPDQ